MSRPNNRITNLPHALSPNGAGPTTNVVCGNVSKTLAVMGAAIDGKTQHVLVSVEGTDVRICPDGTPATAALGHRVYVGDQILLSRDEAMLAQFISTGANATLQVSQYLI